ncbi:hypothetical protein C2E23DRAFT_370018 [Lenzites betulinus]|nr:hypothetical protein C2E23DRAFT_370018 [Lenzites betulinus]
MSARAGDQPGRRVRAGRLGVGRRVPSARRLLGPERPRNGPNRNRATAQGALRGRLAASVRGSDPASTTKSSGHGVCFSVHSPRYSNTLTSTSTGAAQYRCARSWSCDAQFLAQADVRVCEGSGVQQRYCAMSAIQTVVCPAASGVRASRPTTSRTSVLRGVIVIHALGCVSRPLAGSSLPGPLRHCDSTPGVRRIMLVRVWASLTREQLSVAVSTLDVPMGVQRLTSKVRVRSCQRSIGDWAAG